MSAQDNMNSLQFKKTEAGRYHARGAAHNYIVQRDNPWRLSVYEHEPHPESPGLDAMKLSKPEPKEQDTHDTAGLAKKTAQHYESLGEDYKQSEHHYMNRYTAAVEGAYDTEP